MTTAETPVAAPPLSWWRHPHRRLYNWVLHWADTPYGAVALFLLAFAESSFFPIPPDVLLIALVLGARQRWWRFAALCTAGSVIGGIAGYGIGAALMETVGNWIIRTYHAEAYYAKVQNLYAQYDYWVVLAAAFTPIPYKVFTIASGALDMNFVGFVVVSIFGRGARFVLVAALLRLFGRPLRAFIEKYFDLLSLLFLVLLVGGFVLIKWAH